MQSLKHRIAATVAAAATGVVVLLPAGAAQAETVRVDDGADATASLTDIHTVTVRHGPDHVRVDATFADLRKRGSSGAAVFIDTDADRSGPEFALSTGLSYGTDYQLVRMRKWKPRGEPLSCDHRLRLKYGKDLMKVRLSRSCLGSPSQVRVAMKMVDHSDGSHVITDWMLGKRRFTDWLAKG